MRGEPRQHAVSVLHSMDVWLSQTMTWLYTQIASLSADVVSQIVCNRVENLDQFPMSTLSCARQDGWLWNVVGGLSWQIGKRRLQQRYRRMIARSEVNILHSHFGDRGWADIPVARRSGLKHVVSFYGYDATMLPHESAVWKKRFRDLFASADLFLCEGPHMAGTLVELGCPESKTAVHHLGVPVDTIEYQPRKWTPGDPLKVLIAGSFMEKKGMPYAIDALGKLSAECSLALTIIGDADGQPRSEAEKTAILSALTRNRLLERTNLLGYQPHARLMEEAYRHHVFLSPSVTAENGDSEGGAPVTLLEMAASGMPIVSSLHCDIPNVIEDGKSGLLARERDVDDIAEKLTWLVKQPASWEPMIRRGRTRIEDLFDCRTLATGLEDRYRTLLAV